jgi:hypothetical protein
MKRLLLSTPVAVPDVARLAGMCVMSIGSAAAVSATSRCPPGRRWTSAGCPVLGDACCSKRTARLCPRRSGVTDTATRREGLDVPPRDVHDDPDWLANHNGRRGYVFFGDSRRAGRRRQCQHGSVSAERARGL